MHLDIPTIMIAGSFVAFSCACLLVFGWIHYRANAAPLWLAAGLATIATGIVGVVAAGAAAMPSLAIAADGLFVLGAALVWAAVRRVEERTAPVLLIASGPALALAFDLLPGVAASREARFVSGLAIAAIYYFAAVWTLWHSREEPLPARSVLMGLISFHGGVFVVGIVEALSGRLPNPAGARLNSIFGLIHFESLLFFAGVSGFLFGMLHQRQVLQRQREASCDSLTGVASRAAFLTAAARLLDRSRREGSPLSLLVIDIDRFKQINDGHGHAAGDEVLRTFGSFASSALRPADLVGRLGGDEFAVALPGFAREAAVAVAERLRAGFAERVRQVGGIDIGATISVGVAAAAVGDARIDSIVERADAALYEAKRRGRNTVRAAAPAADEPLTNVVRVA